MYTVVHKNIIGDNSVKCKPIFTIGRKSIFYQNPSNISHFTLTLVPHYLVKFKIVICFKNQSMRIL